MSGSRPIPQGTNERSSLDALSRTIEGLEARIEGLIGSSARDHRQKPEPAAPYAAQQERAPRSDYAAAADREQLSRADHLTAIRQRQRVLEASRERSWPRRDEPAADAYAVRPPETPRREAAPAPRQPDALSEIAGALVALRQDLKRDIAEGVAREVGALREEMRTIRNDAEERNFAADMRADLARLSDSINQLAGEGAHPDAEGLKSEFDALHSLMDGLAREDSIREIEQRSERMEERLHTLDTSGLREELVTLAYRIDDIKRQLGGMSQSPAVHALEEKLISIAGAMEHFGSMMQPHDRAMSEQFSAIDLRLDEISRAIVASGRTASAAADPALIHRLDSRIAALADQIDLISEQTSRRPPAEDLSGRIEALTHRIEQLSNAEAAAKLEERLDHLFDLMQRSQAAAPQPELTGHLADISRKIDALEQGSVNDALAERLEYLARRIDELDFAPQAAPAGIDDAVANRLESRLADIAARLEQSTAAPPTDPTAMRGLEEQIAHLSALMSEPRAALDDTFHVDFDRRMTALEDYMSTNDEYIIEAARQAAETVVAAYAHGSAPGTASAADMSALTALADDLRHLEELSRSTDERTHRTFEALHDTLVQIADRLDHMEQRQPPVRMPAADFHFDHQHPAEPAPAARAPAAAHPVYAEETLSLADEPPVAELPVETPAAGEGRKGAAKTRERTSLLAGLGKKLRSGRKTETAVNADRPLIDPTPSIDPVDVVATEEPNELLEPGSGAPDIKKIMERVRATQAARAAAPGRAGDHDRADYIAAARRAAQAAALEVDQAPRASAAKKGDKAVAAKPEGASAFSRYRRPILLAVGAALLAIMSLPLVHTVLEGRKAPQPVQTENARPASAAKTAPAATAPAAVSAPAASEANAPAAPASVAPAQTSAPPPSAQQSDAAPPAAAAPAVSDHLTTAAPLGSDNASETLTPVGAPTPDASAFAPAAPTVDATAAQPAPAESADISVPDAIQPASLADAARKGDTLALFEIGARYTDGRGVAADLKQAANWYKLAAEKGFAPAQYRLASMYEKGTGLDRDLAKAKEYYELAAAQGNVSSMHNLAVLLASGAIGKQDYDAAANWFIKAANLGVADSQFNLAILYARGNGVKQDLEECYKWFAIAAKAGDKDAAQKRDEVAAALKRDQLDSARAKVDQWKAEPVDAKANNADIPDEWAGKGVHTASIDMKKAIRNIQAILNNNGFDAGQPDGEMGQKTVAALKSFQKSVGLTPDGKVNDTVVKELLARNTPKK